MFLYGKFHSTPNTTFKGRIICASILRTISKCFGIISQLETRHLIGPPKCTQTMLDERENVEVLKHYCSFPNVFFIQKKQLCQQPALKKLAKIV